RGWPAHVRGRVAFRLTDALAPWNDGAWELTVEDGAGTLARAAAEPDLTLDVRGFAVLYCGAATGRAAAQAGLAGGNGDPAALDLLASGPPARLLDYF
ncbi:sterol carrier protein domain-containing protein, partial [Modestobacter versicolor]